MNRAVQTVESRILLDEVLADLGGLVRRVQAGSLQQDEFYDLTRGMRRKLKVVRAELTADVEITLTDIGLAIGRLVDAGMITPASQLLPPGVNRARTVGHLVVLDGGLTPNTNETEGA